MNANSDREYIDNKVGDVRTAVDDLRVTMNERFEGVRSQFGLVYARFDAIDAKIESAVEGAKAEIIKWIAGLLVAMIAMFIAMIGLMVNLLTRQPPAPVQAALPAISTPAVIIQLTPQGATVLPAAPAVAAPGGKP